MIVYLSSYGLHGIESLRVELSSPCIRYHLAPHSSSLLASHDQSNESQDQNKEGAINYKKLIILELITLVFFSTTVRIIVGGMDVLSPHIMLVLVRIYLKFFMLSSTFLSIVSLGCLRRIVILLFEGNSLTNDNILWIDGVDFGCGISI